MGGSAKYGGATMAIRRPRDAAPRLGTSGVTDAVFTRPSPLRAAARAPLASAAPGGHRRRPMIRDDGLPAASRDEQIPGRRTADGAWTRGYRDLAEVSTDAELAGGYPCACRRVSGARASRTSSTPSGSCLLYTSPSPRD